MIVSYLNYPLDMRRIHFARIVYTPFIKRHLLRTTYIYSGIIRMLYGLFAIYLVNLNCEMEGINSENVYEQSLLAHFEFIHVTSVVYLYTTVI